MKIAALFLLAFVACAQNPGEADFTIDADARNETVNSLIDTLNKQYIFPETAAKMEKALRAHQYDSVTSGKEFARLLTEDLQEVSKDKHLRVNSSSEKLPANRPQTGPPTAEERERMRQNMSRLNFGFERVERLNGNIGYLDLRGFFPVDFAADTAVAAMNFISNTDALIIDLRKNGGGDPATVALLCSYLFEGEVHLNDLYFRPADSTHQWWTLPFVPGKRFIGKDVYVITSKRTFSAAEEFTYNLKNQKRATIVGETTGGGAHPGGFQRLSDHFGAFIPSGRAINPISKTNWEGTGVTPDIAISEELGVKRAHHEAVKKLLAKETDARRKTQLEEVAATLEKELKAQTP